MSEEPTLPRFGRRRLLAGAAALAAAPALAACEAGPVSRPRRAAPRGHGAPPNARPALITAMPALDGQGARVFRLFPQQPGDHQDPFILLDDFRVTPPAGFPLHPHRGFEAFTYMIDGSFHHRDTMGNDSVVTNGGTQRFTSGRGARHSEMPAEERVNHGLQLWVNLPPELKRIEPEYEAIHGPDIPEQGRGQGARGDLVVRTVVGPGSPVRLRTAVRYLDLEARGPAAYETEVPAGSKALVYVVSGQVRIGDVTVEAGKAALPVPGELALRTEGPARFVYLAGASQGQPIRHHGPFVD